METKIDDDPKKDGRRDAVAGTTFAILGAATLWALSVIVETLEVLIR